MPCAVVGEVFDVGASEDGIRRDYEPVSRKPGPTLDPLTATRNSIETDDCWRKCNQGQNQMERR